MLIPDPDNTARNCPAGCGLTTVLADLGDGRKVRVHCGTFRTACPGQPTRQTPHTWTRYAWPAHAA
ncbi:hypothetical protein AB0A74_24790 [Saccharothrix sp. NPDC042600]|uniref:hypothetical protein n=1 Tax=Saccharothrix TaxID=2071 RepID=UPI0033F585D1|nr:hypothetical protein GCM10017745_17980 [Saccharothrix mutabilis subsp. capreolus]